MSIGMRRFWIVLTTNLGLLALQGLILWRDGGVVNEILLAVGANTTAYLAADGVVKAVRSRAGMTPDGTQLVAESQP